MEGRFGSAIRKSFDEVFDGQRTGRYSLAQLSKVEKTYIGTKIEIVVQAEFGLRRGRRMDYLVDDQEVDAKWSMKSGGWMIPTEAVGELCLCMTADDAASTFAVGLVRANELRLTSSANKDSKRRLNEAGLSSLAWLVQNGSLDENLLLHLGPETRPQVLDEGLSGQKRVDQLFRLVQGRVIRREVLLTVARQADGPKRARDSRLALQPEGILVLGHQGRHPAIAVDLGLPAPPKGSWISVRVISAHPHSANATEIDGYWWRTARLDDPTEPGPNNYT
jgi:hypothetical protein